MALMDWWAHFKWSSN